MQIDGLRKADTQHRNDYALHRIYTVIGDSVAAANNGFPVAEHAAEETAPYTRVPGRGNAGGPIAVIHGEYIAPSTLTNGYIRECWIKNISVQRGLFLGIEVIERIENLIAIIMVGDQGLLPVQLMGRRLPSVGQAIGQRKRRLQSPGILAEEVIRAQGGSRDKRRTQGFRLQIAIADGKNAHVIDQSEGRRVETVPLYRVRRGESWWRVGGRNTQESTADVRIQ